MKTFTVAGNSRRTDVPVTWERRYYELLVEYCKLKEQYDKLQTQRSWEQDTTRWGA